MIPVRAQVTARAPAPRRRVTMAFVCALAAALIPGAGRAEPMYQVELIVFHHLQAAASDAPATMTMHGDASNIPDAPHAIEVAPLPAEAMLLAESARRLDRSKAYRTVLHIGWRQNAAQSQPVRIGDRAGIEESGVRGFAALQVGQQLAFSADVACRRQGDVAAIHARRSIRIGELHYVDDPMCGLLVQVTRVRETAE
jgi:hypothetical protein